MANVVLDALIRRADFCEADAEGGNSQKIPAISLQQLAPGSFLVPSLRKPDFQRETNHWSPDQVITFIKSFLDNELVPSLIFWRSPGKVFVIDGGHRISALLAWVNDDYGDGGLSKEFFGTEIPQEQRRIAESLRKRVNREIGSFRAFADAMQKGGSATSDALFSSRVQNAIVRTIDLQ